MADYEIQRERIVERPVERVVEREVPVGRRTVVERRGGGYGFAGPNFVAPLIMAAVVILLLLLILGAFT